MSARARTTLIAGAALLVLIGLGYSAWWWRLARIAEANLDRWIADRQQAGWTVTTGTVALSGFPFDLHLTLSTPAIADAAGNSWRGPPVTAILPPLRLTQPHLLAPGRHQVTWAGHPPLAIDAEAFEAQLGIAAGKPDRIDLDAAGLAADGNQLGHLTASWRQLAPGTLGHDQASMSLDAELSGITLATAPEPWLDKQIDSVRLSARLLGALQGTTQTAVAAWSQDGGSIEADSFALAWVPVHLDGNFTLALNSALQPLLSGTASAQGLDQLVGKMGDTHALTPAQATLGRIALAALAKPNSGGTVTVPVTIQNQVLSLGPLPILRLKPLAW